jgi:alpha-ribazole phosphatase
MKIILIRHGYTEANTQNRYCGRTDLPLSAQGVKRLNELKAQGTYPQVAAFFTSGMLRARQTLALLYGDAKAISMPELAEYDFGAFEMRQYKELKYDPAYIAWITDDSGEAACPEGESKRQYARRVTRGFSHLLYQLRAMNCPSAAAVVHGGTIVQIMTHLFPDEKDFYRWQPRPGLGYILSRNRDGVFTYQTIKGEDAQ